MARLRQSLTGTALEAIRGLGVSDPEYKEAKGILQPKFGYYSYKPIWTRSKRCLS